MRNLLQLHVLCIFFVFPVLLPQLLYSQCGSDPSSGSFSVAAANTIVNSYYPGTGSPIQGNTSLIVGAIDARGSATAIGTGDLVMIIQMQGADISANNADTYGDGVAGAPGSGYLASNLYAGTYEYNTVSSVAGSTINFSYGIAFNYYTQAYGATAGIRSYQVIRIPRYYDLSIAASSSVTAPAWNGSTGGIVVLDAANTLSFAAATSSVTVAGKGFRGGGGKQFTGAAGLTNTDFRFNSAATTAANASGGSKGEGIAGTPIYLPNTSTSLTVTGTLEGYINGSMGRGAPGNAGGGGTDGQPSANQYNTGGGGGSNKGAGGTGGSGWDGTGGNSAVYPTGGAGGTSFSQSSISTVIMGGGGGAGSANNSTSATEFNCSGASGGGIIFMRAKTYSGNGSLIADGAAAVDIAAAGQTDAAGGGGGGGSIIVVTRQTGATGLGSVTASAKGGKGGNMTTYYSHGPGGGGGGGIIITNGTLGSATVTGGANGLTHTCCATGNPLTDNYGATAGGAGALITLGFVPVFKNPAIPASPCGVLPIVISNFKAVVGNANKVHLSWSAEQAVNFNEFEIQTSTDGLHFSNAGTVLFYAGKSNYEFLHQPTGNTLNYYRLKLDDYDRHFTYSVVLTVRLSGNNAGRVSVYPNPAKNNVTIRILSSVTETSMLRVLDNSGRLLVSKHLNLATGQNFISIPELDPLPAGLYHLEIGMEKDLYTEKILKN